MEQFDETIGQALSVAAVKLSNDHAEALRQLATARSERDASRATLGMVGTLAEDRLKRCGVLANKLAEAQLERKDAQEKCATLRQELHEAKANPSATLNAEASKALVEWANKCTGLQRLLDDARGERDEAIESRIDHKYHRERNGEAAAKLRGELNEAKNLTAEHTKLITGVQSARDSWKLRAEKAEAAVSLSNKNYRELVAKHAPKEWTPLTSAGAAVDALAAGKRVRLEGGPDYLTRSAVGVLVWTRPDGTTYGARAAESSLARGERRPWLVAEPLPKQWKPVLMASNPLHPFGFQVFHGGF